MIRDAQTDAFRLFNLVADPGELLDLSSAGSTEVLRMAGELSGKLEAFRKRGAASGPAASLSEEELRRMKSLGYVE
jgi:hypothetical protein